MEGQLIHDWEERYEGNRVPPWEDGEPNREFISLVRGHCSPGARVLELGAGLGHNARELARAGIDVTASDVSENAVRRCREAAGREGVDLPCIVLDALGPPPDIGTWDVVFEKGCWHTFFGASARARFVESVRDRLPAGGLWITATGSAETPDDPEDPDVESYPRFSRSEILRYVEADFEVVEIREGRYGRGGDRNFLTWECVFRRRYQLRSG